MTPTMLLRGGRLYMVVGTPGGPIRALRPPFGLETRMSPVPALNEHGDEIRRELT